jgi:hypothetical protein
VYFVDRFYALAKYDPRNTRRTRSNTNPWKESYRGALPKSNTDHHQLAHWDRGRLARGPSEEEARALEEFRHSN